MQESDLASNHVFALSDVADDELRKRLTAAINLMENVHRGLVGEVLVAMAMGGEITDDWSDWDVELPDGRKVEVKTTGPVQAWPQGKASDPIWSVGRSEGWVLSDGVYVVDRTLDRRSDLYVFAVHTGTHPDDFSEWRFYVVDTAHIDRELGDQKTISEQSLVRILDARPLSYQELSVYSAPEVPQALFLYGTLMPGQVGYHFIEEAVRSVQVGAVLADHQLVVRDGLPFVRPMVGSAVHGVVVTGGPRLMQLSRQFEGLTHATNPRLYWEAPVDVVFEDGTEVKRVVAFLQKGATGRGDAEPVESGLWEESMDPVFRAGFPRLYQAVQSLLLKQEKMMFPGHADYWPAMWEVQGAYLSLSSVVERFGLFVFGRGIGPTNAMRMLDRREATVMAEALVLPSVEVYSMKTRSNTPLRSSTKPFETWYQVRSNLLHQGKDFRDFQRLVDSTQGLQSALAFVLPRRIHGLVDRWDADLDRGHPLLEFLSQL